MAVLRRAAGLDLEHVEDRWETPCEEDKERMGLAGGEGRAKLFEVRELESDLSFMRTYLTKDAVEELDLEDWVEEELELTEAPEDWTGSVDVEPEDYENEVESVPSESRLWADPLQYVDRGEISGYSEIELPESPDELERY